MKLGRTSGITEKIKRKEGFSGQVGKKNRALISLSQRKGDHFIFSLSGRRLVLAVVTEVWTGLMACLGVATGMSKIMAACRTRSGPTYIQNDFFIEECHDAQGCAISLISKDDSVLWLVD